MATKPSSVPDWLATTHGEAEPISAKKTAGWSPGEFLPAQATNWFWILVSQWLTYLQDLNLSNNTWSAIQTFQNAVIRLLETASGDADKFTPNARFEDSNGDTRMFIDNIGLLGGAVIVENYHVNPNAGTIAVSSNGTITPGLLQGHTGANITIDTQSAISVKDRMPSFEFNFTDPVTNEIAYVAAIGSSASNFGARSKFMPDGIIVMEWWSTFGGTITGLDFYAGLHSNPDVASPGDGTAYGFAMFRKLSTDTNWQCVVGEGSTGQTVADSGVVPATSTYQHFRIEFHGDDSPLGVENSIATCVFFIDGVQVAEMITNTPSSGVLAQSCTPFWRGNGDGTGPTATRTYTVVPGRHTYVPYLTDFSPQ